MEALQRINSLDEMVRLGDIFQKSGFFKDLRESAQAVTKILYGAELGFSPVVSIMGIYIVDGKPALSANLLGAMVKRSGKYDYKVRKSTGDQCILDFYEKGELLGTYSFDIEEARQASLLGKDNWRKYPKAMLFARALSAGIRTYCPDISTCSLYVPEELGAEVNGEGDVTKLPVAISSETVVIERKPVKTPEVVVVKAQVSTSGATYIPDETEKETHKEVLAPVELPTALKQVVIEPDDPFIDDPYIDSVQAGKIAKRFRESLREELQPMAEELRHNALGYYRFVDKNGNPSGLMIKKKDFIAVGKKLVEYAKGL